MSAISEAASTAKARASPSGWYPEAKAVLMLRTATVPVPMASLRGTAVLGRRSLDGLGEVGLSAMVSANALG